MLSPKRFLTFVGVLCAAFTDPHHYSIGIRHVFVAGEQVLDEGQMTAARPGRFLERADRQR
jgi:hypothetical protein